MWCYSGIPRSAPGSERRAPGPARERFRCWSARIGAKPPPASGAGCDACGRAGARFLFVFRTGAGAIIKCGRCALRHRPRLKRSFGIAAVVGPSSWPSTRVTSCCRPDGLIRWNFGEFRHLVVDSGIAYPARTAPGVDHPADVDDHCSVLAELTSGAQVAFTVSRVAHGTNDQSLEAWGSGGAIRYRLTREGSRWFEGELAVSPGGADFRPWRRAGRRRPRPARATRATSWARR
jgi:hypothetical protein